MHPTAFPRDFHMWKAPEGITASGEHVSKFRRCQRFRVFETLTLFNFETLPLIAARNDIAFRLG
jgi:hypothetical protein